MKRQVVRFFFAFLLAVLLPELAFSQVCNVTITHPSSDTTICLGDSVYLRAEGSCDDVFMNNDFENGVGAGWSTTHANPTFPSVGCDPEYGGPGVGPDGRYLWVGTNTAAQRTITTETFDISIGNCYVKWWMRYGRQDDAGTCEDPNSPDEGVHLQYSVGGGAWQDFPGVDQYAVGPNTVDPPFVTTVDGTGGYWTPAGYCPAPDYHCDERYNNSSIYWWHYFVSPVPIAAISTDTRFRFAQRENQQDYDSWGVDEVMIYCSRAQAVVWSHGPAVLEPPNPVSPTTTTSYWVMVYDSLGNFDRDTVTIFIAPHVDLGSDVTICDDGSSTAYLDAGAGFDSYLWSTGATTQVITPNTEGWYWCTVVWNGSCTTTDSIYLTVAENALASAGSDESVCENESWDFANSSTQPSASNYSSIQWFGGTGSFSDPGTLWPVYTPGAGDAGSVQLGMIANGIPPCEGDTAYMILTLDTIPTADFSWDYTCGEYSVDFIDQSNGNTSTITSWFWDFGDGVTSTLQNPTHGYAAFSSYTVSLIVTTNNSCQDTVSYLVSLQEGPTAAFTSDTACSGEETQFTDLSTTPSGSIIQWIWDFGDGNSASVQNPTHAYSSPGSYVVSLIVGDNNGCYDTIAGTAYVSADPIAAFEADSACEGVAVSFTDLSAAVDGNLISWSWNFGDGNTSLLQNPSHLYASSGTYNVTLTVSNNYGCTDDTSMLINVYDLPIANFDDTSSCFNNTATFTDLSVSNADSLISWLWNFGDGNTSTLQNPVHSYPGSGTYSVTLTVTNNHNCSDDITLPVYIYPQPTAAFDYDTACSGNPTQFTDLSTTPTGNINSWEWDFGDGGTSTLQHPIHIYSSGGTYLVTLIVATNEGCRDTVQQNIEVYPDPLASFTHDAVCEGVIVNFTDLSLPNASSITGWFWDFGDGTTSSFQHPSHTFPGQGTFAVNLTVVNSNGCSDDTTLQVQILPGPIAEFSDSTTCLNFTAYFTDLSTAGASAIVSWLWDFGDGNTSSLQNPVYSYAAAGTYSVSLTVTDNNGCQDDITHPVVVFPPPVADFTADTACPGVPTNFIDLSYSAFGIINQWEWDFGDGTTSSMQDPVHIYFSAGTYTVSLVVGNTAGCFDTISQLITVHPDPLATFSYDIVCQGLETHFTDLSVANAGSLVSWYWDFGDGYSSSEQNPLHLFASDGFYLVNLTVENSNGCTDDTTINVEVLESPVADFSDSSSCELITYFTDLSTYVTVPVNAWSWDFGDGGTSSVQNPSHQYASAGTYTVTLIVFNANSCSDTIARPVVVYEAPVADFTSDTACAQSPTQFTDLSVTNYGAINSWAWTFGDGGTSSQQNPAHIYTAPGTYTAQLIIVTVGGCSDTIFHPVEVYPLPVASFTTSPVCDGDTMYFTDLSTANAASITSWLWNFGDGGTSTQQNPSHLYVTNGTYDVTLSIINANGCSDDTTMQVEVYPNPIANFSDSSDCSYNAYFTDLSVANASGITSWLWNFGDGNTSGLQNPSHTYATFGTYNVSLTVVNINGCENTVTIPVVIYEAPTADFTSDTACAQSPTQFTDLSVTNYGAINSWQWTFGDGGTSTQQNPAHVYSTPGTYTAQLIIVTVGGCSDTISHPVEVYPLPVASFSSSPVCNGDTMYFTDLSTPNAASITSWLWNFGDGGTSTQQNPSHLYVTNGTYDVTLSIINANGCSDDTTIQVEVYPNPIANFSDSSDCAYNAYFTDLSVANATGISSWLWDFGDGNTSGLQNPSHTYATFGTYNVSLTVVNTNGCENTVTIPVVIYEAPTADFISDTACAQSPTQFTDLSVTNYGAINSWAWTFGDGGTSSQQNPSHVYTAPGTYTAQLIIVTVGGCSDTISHPVEVYPLPVASFTTSPVCDGDTMYFTDLSTPNAPGITSWLWNFGDGGTSTAQNPSHLYVTNGTYDVTLSIINANGCSDDTTIQVEVYPNPIANFSDSSDCSYHAYFTDLSVANASGITSWFWDFGDGNTSGLQNPSHTYATFGTYNVLLTVVNTNGCENTVTIPVVIYEAPTADFTSDTACAQSPTQFTDLSVTNYGAINSWAWTFGDGGTSTQQNPAHIYTAPGTYTAQLIIVTVGGCSDTISHPVEVYPLPVASFSSSPVCNGDTMYFTDLSTPNAPGITSWLWNFGDGGTSTAQNPSHLYVTNGTYDVTLSIINANGCSDDTTIQVEVYPNPIANFSDSSDCSYNAYFTDLSVANASGITSWLWDFGDGNTSTAQNPSHTYATFGTYNVSLTVINTNGCENTVTIPVVIYEAPTADFTSDTACAQSPTQFTDLSVTNYGAINSWQWTFGDGGTSTQQNPAHVYTAPGTYTAQLIIVTVGGCSDTIFHPVEVYPLPVASFSSSPVCNGDTMYFTDLSTPNAPSITSWLWNFGDGGTSTAQNPSHLYVTNGTYDVTLSIINANGCSDDTTMQVEVYPNPIANFSDSSDCSYNAYFTDLSVANASGITSWLWDFGDGNTSGLQNPSHTYAAFGTYNVSLTVINTNGCENTVTIPVVIYEAPTADFTSDTACAQSPTQFTDLSVTNYGAINSWAWTFGDGGTSTQQNPAHIYTAPGTYTAQLIIVTVGGCSDTISHAVEVYPLPVASFSTSPVCDGDTMYFTDLSTPNAPSITSWLWNFGDGGTSTQQNPSHLYVTNGTYDVTLSIINANGCSDDTTIQVEVYPNPIANFSDSSDCSYHAYFTDLSVANASGITSWFWDFGDGNTSGLQNPTHTYASFGTYNVSLTVINTNGCENTVTIPVVIYEAPTADFTSDTACAQSPTQFTDLSVTNYGAINSWQWTFGDGGTSTQQNPAHVYSAPGTYTAQLIIVTVGGCSDTISHPVEVYPLPVASFSTSPVCDGDTMYFTDLSTANAASITSWLWNFGDGGTSTAQNPSHLYVTNGTYDVTLSIINANGCSDDTTIQVEVYPNPIANFSDSSDCSYNAYFTDLSVANATGIASWLWDFGDGNTSGLQNPTHTYASFGTYNVSLTVINTNGCENTVTIPVVIYEAPTADFTSDTACAQSPTQFTDLSVTNYGAINSWQWTFGDGGTSSQQNPAHIYTAPGTYTAQLIIVTVGGCSDTISHPVEVYPLPVASFSSSPVCNGDTMYFTDLSTPNAPSITSWLWNFGDGGTSTQQNPSHLYVTNGTYDVTLSIINSNGCSDDTTMQVEVYPNPIANFSDSSDCSYNAYFTDLSVANATGIASWLWDFGDGNTSGLQNPSHTYATFGTYNVSLTVVNTNGCENTVTISVVIYEAPTADFISDTACAQSPTKFTDLSVTNYGAINSWQWTFGDGGTSSQQNPSHVYTAPGTYTAQLIIVTVGGCSDTISHPVEVYPLPVASFSTSPVCNGDTMYFTDLSTANAASITSWLWNFGDGGTSTAQNPSHLYVTNGTYNVLLTVTNANGCSDDTTMQVEVYPNPIANFSDSSDCSYNAYFTDLSVANASGISSWLWDFGDGEADTIQNPVHQYDTAGTFMVTLIIVNTNGCQDELIRPVVVHPGPLAAFIADTVCAHSPTHFTDLSSTTYGTINAWFWDFGDGNTSTLQNPDHIYTNPGTYAVSLIVTTAEGCSDTASGYAEVEISPTAMFEADDVCYGYPVSFTDQSVANIGSIVSWNWNFGDGSFSNAQDPTHFYTAAGVYAVNLTVVNSIGCSHDSTQLVEVYSLPVPLFSDSIAASSLTVYFTDESIANADSIIDWIWAFGDGDSAFVQNPVHTYPGPGMYVVTLTVTNSNACVGSQSTMINVQTDPVANFIADTVCFGSPTQFFDLSIPNADSISSWFWNFGDGDTSNLQNPTHLYTAPGSYNVSLTVTNSIGGIDSYSQLVLVRPLPIVAFSDSAVCGSLEVYFTDLSLPSADSIVSWWWDFSDGDTSVLQHPVHLFDSMAYYDVTLIVTNNEGCLDSLTRNILVTPGPIADFTQQPECVTEPVQFTDLSVPNSGSIVSWDWDFGDGGSSTQQNPVHVYALPGSYSVSLIVWSSSGCADTVIKDVEIYELPEAAFETTTPLCDQSEIQFNDLSVANADSLTAWYWDFGDGSNDSVQHPVHIYSTAGIYQVILRVWNSNGCQDDTSMFIEIFTSPTADFYTSQPVCVNEMISFFDISLPGSDSLVSWYWDFGDGTTSVLQNPTHTYVSIDTFDVSLTVTNVHGCTSTIIHSLFSNETPIADFDFIVPCIGQATQFNDLSYNTYGLGTITAWFWDFGDGDTSILQNPTHIFASAGVYPVSLTVYNSSGCYSSIVKNVQIFTGPLADFTYFGTCIGTLTQFNEASTTGGSNIINWWWDFGDGDTAMNVQNPAHLYAAIGNYTVSLIVEDENGCMDTVVRVIEIYDHPLADFSADTVCVGSASQFTDLSTPSGVVTNWNWNFGDPASGAQNYSTLQHPTHVFSSEGYYDVSLIISDTSGCTDTVIHQVYADPAPLADFTYVSGICANNPVQFIDLSGTYTGDLEMWIWNFGDGSIDTVMSPMSPNVTHVFQSVGQYFVELTVYNTAGCAASITRVVVINNGPDADFTWEASCVGEEVQFHDITPGGDITSREWDFGDPATGAQNYSILQDPAHIFSDTGTYLVQLVVTDLNGCTDTVVKQIVVQPLIDVEFFWIPACEDEVTQFYTDTNIVNTNIVTNYLWDFGDGYWSNLKHPGHVFDGDGWYNVTLTITDTLGCQNSITHQVLVKKMPNAFFDVTEPTCLGDSVFFNDQSTTAVGYLVSWVWDYDDGSPLDSIFFPDDPHTWHIYDTIGTFGATLTVTNSEGCSHTFMQEVHIIPNPEADFIYTHNCSMEPVQFLDRTDTIGQGDITYSWNFGDPASGVNNTSALQNPQHTYSIGDTTYTVTLIIENFNGCSDSIVKGVYIQESPDVAFLWDVACEDTATHFYPDSVGMNVYTTTSWFWDFGDGTYAYEPEVYHQFQAPGSYFVSLSIQDTGSCSNVYVAEVIVNESPVAAFTIPQIACQSAPVYFDELSYGQGTYIGSWHWDFGDGTDTTIFFPDDPDVYHTYEFTGTYAVTLTAIGADSCDDQLTQYITVGASPEAMFEYENTCFGDPVQFTDLSSPNQGGSIVSWFWDFDDPNSGVQNTSTLQNPEHTFTEADTFNVMLVVNNVGGCPDTVFQTVEIAPPPPLEFSFEENCSGQETYFYTDTTVTNVGAVMLFNWDFGDGSPTSNMMDPVHYYDAPGTYTVVLTITDYSGCENSVSHEVEVKENPVALFSFASQCDGSPVSFLDASYMNSGELIIEWHWNFDDPSSGASNYSTEQNPQHLFSTYGLYIVQLRVVSEGGCTDSTSIPVSIYRAPDAAFTAEVGSCTNGHVSFFDASIAYQSQIVAWDWEFEPGYASAAQNPEHSFLVSDTTYTVMLAVLDDKGCRDTVFQDVYIPSEMMAVIHDTNHCYGEAMQFSAEILQPLPNNIYSCEWNFGDPASGSANISQLQHPMHVFTHAGEFTVSVDIVDMHGCTASLYKQIMVEELPVPEFTYDVVICDSIFQFTDLSYANGFEIVTRVWDFGDGTPPVVLSGTGNGDVIHEFEEYGTYEVSLQLEGSNGCFSSISQEVVYEACLLPGFAILGELSCQYAEVIFSDSSSVTELIDEWYWDFGDGTDTLYHIPADSIIHIYREAGEFQVRLGISALINGTLFTDTLSKYIAVRPGPQNDFFAADVCAGSSMHFADSTENVNAYTVSWHWNFGTGLSGDTSSLPTPNFLYENSGEYDVSLMTVNNWGCWDTITKDVHVRISPEANFEYTTGCLDEMVYFTDLSTAEEDDEVTAWRWNFGDGTSEKDTSILQDPAYRYDYLGEKQVELIVKNTIGCTDTIKQWVSIHPTPTAGFSIIPNYEQEQGNIALEDYSMGAESYYWDFGDGFSVYDDYPPVIYRYEEDGVYPIQQIVWNEFGCPDTLVKDYNFLFKTLFIPNALNPNGIDPEIRVFTPKGRNLRFFHIAIYNSWGELMWESDRLDAEGRPVESWDGTYKGKLVPTDVYIWKAEAVFKDGTFWEGEVPGHNNNLSESTSGYVVVVR